ncbi:nuclear envelope integral membrane protein 1-like [Drosophila miranda]|uniref:nuclear envelope integral membrane protein 1-like n=1 Tax=Drosophila miranda TaxID=7229 RepID=UPI00143F3B79|nr:nuclear envelope integral membrane protein 1-like [Drosophila miranda]
MFQPRLRCGSISIFTLMAICAAATPPPITDTVFLAPGSSIDITANKYGPNTLRTYCYPGKPQSLLSLFETVEFFLDIGNDDYTEYWGRTAKEVLDHYNEQRSLFSLTLFSQKRQRIHLSPFEPECIGVSSRQPYNVRLHHAQFDVWRFLQFGLGVLVFCSSRTLAKNSIFYYLAGIVLGICCSLLLIISLTSKLFPRRPVMYGVLIGGWTIGLYILMQLADNLRLILLTYRDYVVWYLIITGLISFLVCYRIGPPKNRRSQNIIMWLLQAVGGGLAYFSSWHSSGVVFLIVSVFVAYYFPQSIVVYGKALYRRRIPPKRRLLTEEEYYQQTVNETQKSLAQLREFVNSPNCKQWNIMSNLRNPIRFASFANGEPHLFDEEIEDYSRTIEESMEAADQNEAEDYLQCSMHYRPLSNHGFNVSQDHRRRAPMPQLHSPAYQRDTLRANIQQPYESDSDDDEYTEQD